MVLQERPSTGHSPSRVQHTIRLGHRFHAIVPCALLLYLWAMAPMAGTADDFYVSPTGSDAAAGSKAEPFKSVQTALTAARSAGTGTPHSVVLAPGTYPLSAPLTIDLGIEATVVIALRAEDPAHPPVLDGSALPKVADSKTSNDALLTCKGGRILLEGLHLSHTPGHGIKADFSGPLQIRRCAFSDIHGHAIRASGMQDGVIDSCDIQDVDGTGIWLFGGNPATLAPANTIVSNNRISNVNRWSEGGDVGNGIYVTGIGFAVRQNTIENSVREPWTMGIRVGGGNHVVEKNRLSHVSHGDAGAIYVGGKGLHKRGNIVRFNYIEDCAKGIYVDDRASGDTVTGNVVVHATNAGIFIGGGQDNTVTQNVVAASAAFLRMDNRGMGWTSLQNPFKDDFAKLQSFLSDSAVNAVYLKAYPALANVNKDNVLLPLDNTASDNYADRQSSAIVYSDMDKLLQGKHERAYEKWNKIKEPRSFSLPKGKPLDLSRLGAPGLTTDLLGAQPPPATAPSK